MTLFNWLVEHKIKVAVVLFTLISLVFTGTYFIKTGATTAEPQPAVDTVLGDGDLTCSAPTDDPNIRLLAPITNVDGWGGYDTAEGVIDYFAVKFPGLPLTELQKTQFNDQLARFEVPGKAVLIAQKSPEGLWQPSLYSLCPGTNWRMVN